MKKIISTFFILIGIITTGYGQVTINITDSVGTNVGSQIEFSAGNSEYTNFIGSIGLKIRNSSIQNTFTKIANSNESHQERVGQSLYLIARSNGNQYSSISLSFLEPWFGGKYPNSLLSSIYYSSTSGMSDRYLSSESNYNSMFYNGNSPYGSSNTVGLSEIDPSKYMRSYGFSMSYSKGVKWADDKFRYYSELSYQLYQLSNFNYTITPLNNGNYNNLSLGFTLSHNTINNSTYTTKGSMISLGIKVTPPYSLFNNIKYTDPNITTQDRYKFVEYYKCKFTGQNFTPVSSNNKLILLTKIQFGYLGYYNNNAQSPLERFDMGGSGMASNLVGLGSEIVSMRGYSDGSISPKDRFTGIKQGNVFNKFTFELRYPLLMNRLTTIYLLSFAEAGNCFSSFNDYNPFNLKNAAGLGLRFHTPLLGLIRMDWGYGFDKIGELKSGNQFHLIMGQDI